MITMLGSPRRCCDGLTRRETLRAGALSALGGLTLTHLLHAEEARPAPLRPGKAKSVIVLYLLGGAPSQDMYDLKPAAPDAIRGEFKPIASNVPGIEICEHLPRTARWMHRAALVRSVNHKAGCHNTLPSYTGYEVPLDNIVTTRDTYPPSMGSVCEFLNPTGPEHPPAYVYMPCYLGWGQSIRRPGPYAGFLGKRYDPLFTECSPYIDKDAPAEAPGHPQVLRGEPHIPNSVLGDELTIDRLNTRRGLLAQLDDALRAAESARALGTFDRQRHRAFGMLTSSRARAAFDLEQEDPKLRERYGRTLFGSSALIARRLVEAGVRFVNVTWDCYWERLRLQYDCWDTHTRNFAILRDYNLPYLDLTYSALMEDLDQRGLLDETLVVVMSDFGRTPKINPAAGRDHWTFCYSVLLAGAGIRGGTVHGASDAQAAYVKDKPVSTGDVCATIYHCLGIDPALLVRDQAGRPVAIAHGGTPIREILA
jgi:hypothetical protein